MYNYVFEDEALKGLMDVRVISLAAGLNEPRNDRIKKFVFSCTRGMTDVTRLLAFIISL